jgi:hypothetical protein
MHLPAAAGGDHESDNGSHGDLHEMSQRGERAATMTPKTLDPKMVVERSRRMKPFGEGIPRS